MDRTTTVHQIKIIHASFSQDINTMQALELKTFLFPFLYFQHKKVPFGPLASGGNQREADKSV